VVVLVSVALTLSVAGAVHRDLLSRPVWFISKFLKNNRAKRGKAPGSLTIGSPSVTPPTVLRRGEVIPPTIGRPFVVSSTVFSRLEAYFSIYLAERCLGNIPAKKTTAAVAIASSA
jgi:hypothetical protein